MMNTCLGLEEDKIQVKRKLALLNNVPAEGNSLIFVFFFFRFLIFGLFLLCILFFCLLVLCLFFFCFLFFFFLPKKTTASHVKTNSISFLRTDSCTYSSLLLLFLLRKN